MTKFTSKNWYKKCVKIYLGKIYNKICSGQQITYLHVYHHIDALHKNVSNKAKQTAGKHNNKMPPQPQLVNFRRQHLRSTTSDLAKKHHTREKQWWWYCGSRIQGPLKAVMALNKEQVYNEMRNRRNKTHILTERAIIEVYLWSSSWKYFKQPELLHGVNFFHATNKQIKIPALMLPKSVRIPHQELADT